MGLIEVDAHTDADLAHWREIAWIDEIHAESDQIARCEREAIEAIRQFVESRKGVYASISWGKDSTALAHLIGEHFPSVPLVWGRIWPITNPHCFKVRDRFLKQYSDVIYREYQTRLKSDQRGWIFRGSISDCWKMAEEELGCHRITAVRSSESEGRLIRMLTHGASSKNACAPLGWWSVQDIFGYLAKYDLPIHPAYAFTMGGSDTYSRAEVRVDALGDWIGKDRRRQWEQRYYKDRYNELVSMWRQRSGARRHSDAPFVYEKEV